ncbi:MAG TPA: EAL domain-containing protein [Marinobacterium sp.]|nr:EAL domain-containing protein [Marinobacterium sp.]
MNQMAQSQIITAYESSVAVEAKLLEEVDNVVRNGEAAIFGMVSINDPQACKWLRHPDLAWSIEEQIKHEVEAALEMHDLGQSQDVLRWINITGVLEVSFLLRTAELHSYTSQVFRIICQRLNEGLRIDRGQIQLPIVMATASTDDAICTYSDLKKACIKTLEHSAREKKLPYAHFNSAIQDSWELEHNLEKNLTDDMISGNVYLAYQPKYAPTSREIHGVEALIRWKSDIYGSLPPSKFVPLLEEQLLTPLLTRFVVMRALEQAAEWYQNTRRLLPVAVNVPVVCLSCPMFAENILSAVKASGLPVQVLELEITESQSQDLVPVAYFNLNALQEAGVTIAIDDFGTGFSNFSNLAKLPIDKLKIDASFIAPLQEDKRYRHLVAGMINMAHALGMSVVAEGVETADQLRSLEELGCDSIQGFYLSRPVSPEVIELALSSVQSWPE